MKAKLKMTKTQIKEKIETHFIQNFDTVILDPPRAGAITQVTSLGKSNVKKIIYIS